MQQLPGLIFVGFIRIYWKILMHFEINPTQFWVWGRWPEWGWGRRPKWGWRREWDWRGWGRGCEWGCTRILTLLTNPQWINNSCRKNKSQKNKSWNPLTHVIQRHVNNIYPFEMTSFRLFLIWFSFGISPFWDSDCLDFDFRGFHFLSFLLWRFFCFTISLFSRFRLSRFCSFEV